MSDLAHIHHVELLTPEPEGSLRYFHDVLGMEEESRAGQSVFLRGWGEYQRYSLKLTEATTSGLAHMALRAASPEALDRRVAAIDATGLGIGWIDGDHGHGPAYRFRDPDGHVMEVLCESDRYAPPAHLEPSLRNQPQRYTGRGAAVKRLDHVNLLARDVAACRRFATDVLGYRHYEGIVLDDGSEAGAWLSLTIAAHELIYVADARDARRAPAPPRVLGRHARGVPARGGHLPRQRRPHRGRALPPRRRGGLLPLRLRAGRQPHRGHHRRLLRLRPRRRAGALDRGRARARPGVGASRRSRASTTTARRRPLRTAATRSPPGSPRPNGGRARRTPARAFARRRRPGRRAAPASRARRPRARGRPRPPARSARRTSRAPRPSAARRARPT